jgi:hypothetical protein
MNKRIVLGSCAAVVLSLTIASAQGVNQTPTQSPVQGSTQGITGQTRVGTNTDTATQITVTGCVAREAEHTNAGGVPATGGGTGNEFVLANATNARSGATPSAQIAGGVSGSTSTGSAAGATGTSGTTAGSAGTTTATTARAGSAGTAYGLSGSRESELALYVGKRVEIVGTLDANTRGAGASANAGANAGGATTDAGISAQAHATPMQQLTIVSFRPLGGDCK